MKTETVNTFTKNYPHLAWWIENQGWVEIGYDNFSSSLVRVLDEGGLCWEDEISKDLDAAIENAEKFLETEIPDRFGQKIT